jgi:hypothetical protein
VQEVRFVFAGEELAGGLIGEPSLEGNAYCGDEEEGSPLVRG